MSEYFDILIYSKDFCPYCDAAKKWMKNHNLQYTEVKVDSEERKKEFTARCGPAVKTVPQIFVNEERIGGYTDLLKSDFAKTINLRNVEDIDL